MSLLSWQGLQTPKRKGLSNPFKPPLKRGGNSKGGNMIIKGSVMLRQGSQENTDADIMSEKEIALIFKLEQYLNTEVASLIFEKFKVGMRVHL